MKKLDYFLIFLVAAIPFIIYMTNPLIVGADSYFYVNQVCGITEQSDYTILFSTLIHFFECDFLFFKMFMFVMWFGCLVAMAKIGELYDKERGVEAAFIMAGLTLFVLSFFTFENDIVGYFFFFISFFYLIKYDKLGNKFDLILSIIFIIVSGLFWNGAIYWLAVYPIFWIGFLPIAAYMIFMNLSRFLFFIDANRAIAEHAMWISVIYWGLTVLFLYGIVKTDRKIVASFLILCIPALFVVKLYVLCIPFIVLITFNAIRSLRVDKTTVFSSLLMLALMASAFWGMQSYNNFPTVDDQFVIEAALEVDLNIQNVFGPGYFIKYLGGSPSSSGSLGENDYVCKGVVIERSFLEDCNCPIFAEKGTLLAKKCPI